VSRVVSGTIKGVDTLRLKLAAHLKAVNDKTLIALKKSAVLIQASAVSKIQKGPKSGRQYGDHKASAPGEAPATDTGRLVRNIGFEIDTDRKEATVISRAPYSAPLEFGTNDGKILPRPFMQPSFLENLPEIRLLLKEAARG